MPPTTRKRTDADETPARKAPTACEVDGCSNTDELTRGLCPAHWASRRGDAKPKAGSDG